MSFHQLVQEIIGIYSTLISKKVLCEKEKPNYVVDSIDFLNNFKNINDFVTGKVSNQEIYHFLKLLLDVVGLVGATEGTLQPIKLGDTKLIGRKRDLMGIYKGDDSNIDQNMCATLFQGWIKSKKSSLKISKDLRNVVPKSMEACDFLLVHDGTQVLIECKRIHSTKDDNDLIESIINKSLYWSDKAISQFESTENFLNSNNFCRHLILDISAYGKNCRNNFRDHYTVGLSESEEIKQVIAGLKSNVSSKIDEITLCWSELYVFERKPRAFVYRTIPLKINRHTPSLFNYEGWTIEFYPLGKETDEFKELRIASIARTHAWIKASWHGCIDNLITWGPVETHEEYEAKKQK